MSAGPGQPGRPARGAGQGSGTPRWHTAARPPDAHGAGQSETPPLLTAGRRRRRRGRRRYATERRCVPLTTVTDTADGAHSRQYFGTGKGPALGRQGVDGRRARARRARPPAPGPPSGGLATNGLCYVTCGDRSQMGIYAMKGIAIGRRLLPAWTNGTAPRAARWQSKP